MRPILVEVGRTMTNEVSDYTPNDLPRYSGFIVPLLAGIAFTLSSTLSSTSAPFFVAASVAIVSMLIALTWPMWTRPLLWFLIITVGGFHALGLATIPLPQKASYGMAFLPVAAIEMLLSWKVVVGIIRYVDRRKGFD